MPYLIGVRNIAASDTKLKNPIFLLCSRAAPEVKIAIPTTIPTTPEPRGHLPQIQHSTHTAANPTSPPTTTTSPDKGKQQKSFSAPNHQNHTKPSQSDCRLSAHLELNATRSYHFHRPYYFPRNATQTSSHLLPTTTASTTATTTSSNRS